MSFHTQRTADRWRTMPLSTQLLHIGSELKRVEHWLTRGDRDAAAQAVERALELLDLSIQVSQPRARRRELCRAREIMKAWLIHDAPATDVRFLARALVGHV